MPLSDTARQLEIDAPLDTEMARLQRELQRKEAIILAQQTRLDAYFSSSIDAMVQIDFDGKITGWNQQAESTFGWPAAEVIGQKIEQTIIPERFREAHVAGLRRFRESGDGKVLGTLIEIHAMHRDGHEFPVELSITLVDAPGVHEFNAYIRDISERKQAETVIWNQANFDTLTSLPNRNLFLHRLEHEIAFCRRNELSLALLYIDLDRFKEVNDSLGHDMGDLLLIEIAGRLKKSVRSVDTVSRLSGDEFTIILGQLDNEALVERICDDLLGALGSPYQLDNEIVYLTASIGITLFPDDSEDIETLQKHADQAMYAAKGLGRNRYHFFTPDLQERAIRRRNMITDLRLALDQAQFNLHYQPIVDMQARQPRKAEALIRWFHPHDGVVPPDTFIPLTEETGLINDIGNWVFQQASEQARLWRQRFDIDFQVSINTSPVQWIDEGSCMQDWIDYLGDMNLCGEAINVEITEGLLMDASDTIARRILSFRNAHIQLSIDDFGTGYSSLSYLKRFDIDYLKIDRCFVQNLGHDNDDLVLCEAIIAMAHKLGIKVIAEGVESEIQDQILRDSGCDYAQGFLYSKPLDAAGFEALLVHSCG